MLQDTPCFAAQSLLQTISSQLTALGAFFFSSTKVLVGKSFFHLLARSIFHVKAPQNQLDVSTADTIAEK